MSDQLVTFTKEAKLDPLRSDFFILRILENTMRVGFNRMESLLVIAATSQQARLLAEEQAKKDGGDNCPEIWRSSELTSCKRVGKWQFKKPTVILTDCVNG